MRIARRTHLMATLLADAAARAGFALRHACFFDTVAVEAGDKANGRRHAGIASEFLVESGLYGLLGGVLGTALGYVFAAALTTVVFDRSLDMSWPLAAGSVSVSVVMAILASVPPLRRSSRIDPAVVLREE